MTPKKAKKMFLTNIWRVINASLTFRVQYKLSQICLNTLWWYLFIWIYTNNNSQMQTCVCGLLSILFVCTVPGLSPWTSLRDQTAADPCRPTFAGSHGMRRCISWYKKSRNTQFRIIVACMMRHREKKGTRKSPLKKQLSSHSGGQRTNEIVLLHRVIEIFFQSFHLRGKKENMFVCTAQIMLL